MDSSLIRSQVSLAPYTSFKVGGPAEQFAECHTRDEFLAALQSATGDIRILGYGSNTLISDKGLPSLTIVYRGGGISFDGVRAVVDGSAWWDDLVAQTVERNLWGIELTSGMPSSVAAAIIGNCAAYGQEASDRLVSIDVFDLSDRTAKTLQKNDCEFRYRQSSLQGSPYIILSATFDFATEPTMELRYASALVIAEELKLNAASLADRRTIIMETRRRAGSLYDPHDANAARTAGSFFKNPVVSPEQAEKIASFDESGKALELIKQQNAIHGGSSSRVSAAHVLLAAGFHRGQAWGPVRLHPDHVLKIENTGGATAQQIYDVAQEIITTVKEKLGITLEVEVRFLGDFS